MLPAPVHLLSRLPVCFYGPVARLESIARSQRVFSRYARHGVGVAAQTKGLGWLGEIGNPDSRGRPLCLPWGREVGD